MIDSSECCWQGLRAVVPAKVGTAQHEAYPSSVSAAFVSRPFYIISCDAPLGRPSQTSAHPSLPESDLTVLKYGIASSLEDRLALEANICATAHQGLIGRSDAYASRVTCEGCSRSLMAASRLCLRCGLELCPTCFTALVVKELSRQQSASNGVHTTRTFDDFLACRASDSGSSNAFSTHEPRHFGSVSQIDPIQLTWMSGAAGMTTKLLRDEYCKVREQGLARIGQACTIGLLRQESTNATRPHYRADTSQLRLPNSLWTSFEHMVGQLLNYTDRPVVFDAQGGRWEAKDIIQSFVKHDGLRVRVLSGNAESWMDLTPKQVLEALKGKNSKIQWLSLRDFPTDEDLSQIAPRLDRGFRAGIGNPSVENQAASGEVALFASSITWRDAQAKVYAASASESSIATTSAHVDEAMAFNYCLWAHTDDGVAAEWTIFAAEDFDTVVQAYSEEYGIEHSDVHPIFGQRREFEPAFIENLRQKHGVRPWVVPQRAGQVVMVPQGSIHQVRNLSACFKIAIDVLPPTQASAAARLSDRRAVETTLSGPRSVSALGRDGLTLFPTLLDAFLNLLPQEASSSAAKEHGGPSSPAVFAFSAGQLELISSALHSQQRLQSQMNAMQRNMERVSQALAQIKNRERNTTEHTVTRQDVDAIITERLKQMFLSQLEDLQYKESPPKRPRAE
ncbi:hypothetical protein OC835_006832 [Tilletia horrida]|nr:hypothetical protein OC835_006832 [Tilletia horrida]